MVQPGTFPPGSHLPSREATMTSASSEDPFSPRSSVGSASTDSSCLPRRRIRCSKSQIAVGEQRYQSASDALLDYLRQFDESGTGDREEQALTTPRSSAVSLASNGHVNGTGPVLLKPPTVGSSITRESRGSNLPAEDNSVTLSRRRVGKGLAGSGLVLGSHGIAVAGTREDVEDLLTSKVSPELQEEVTDTRREVKLRRLLKQAALKSKNQTKTGLQQEVEAALVRSAELLEKVTKENISIPQPSAGVDVNSVVSPNSSTLNLELEALLLGNSTLLEDSAPPAQVEDKEDQSSDSLPSTPRKSGHTYSYRTTRSSRAKQRPGHDASLTGSTSRCAPVSYSGRSRAVRKPRASSIDSLLPAAKETSLNSAIRMFLNPKDSDSKRDALCSPSSSDSVPSNQSDPTDLLRQIRSRSMSPGALHASTRSSRGRACGRTESVPCLAPDWVGQLDDSVRKSVPSWVGEMNSSQVSDSVWLHNALLQDENNKRPAVATVPVASQIPSWVGEAEESDINDEEEISGMSKPPLVPLMSTPIKPMCMGSNAEWTLNSLKNNVVSAENNPLFNLTNEVTTNPRPSLNFSDLNTSMPHSPSENANININSNSSNNTSSASIKHVTFTDEPSLQGPPSSPSLSRHKKSPAASPASPHSTGKNRPGVSRVLDSDYNGEAVLRNSILPQTARLRRSMDTFAASSENLRRRSASSSGSSEGGSGGGAASHVTTHCSSLDTVALLTGKPLTRSQRLTLNGDAAAAAGDVAAGRGIDLESSSDGLDGDRPWERMVNTIKAPVPMGKDPGKNEASNTQDLHQPLESTLSGGRQPGSMEALKNMLFRLQAEETSTQDNTDRRGEDVLNSSDQNVSETSMAVIPALENYDFKQEPGGHSLEKALVHLNRLKKLVKTTPSTSSNVSGNEIKTPETAADGKIS